MERYLPARGVFTSIRDLRHLFPASKIASHPFVCPFYFSTSTLSAEFPLCKRRRSIIRSQSYEHDNIILFWNFYIEIHDLYITRRMQFWVSLSKVWDGTFMDIKPPSHFVSLSSPCPPSNQPPNESSCTSYSPTSSRQRFCNVFQQNATGKRFAQNKTQFYFVFLQLGAQCTVAPLSSVSDSGCLPELKMMPWERGKAGKVRDWQPNNGLKRAADWGDNCLYYHKCLAPVILIYSYYKNIDYRHFILSGGLRFVE